MVEDEGALKERTKADLAAWSPNGVITGFEPLPGGASSRTYVATVDGGPPGFERIVVKVAPAGIPPLRNRDVLRQARMLKTLAGHPGIRVPAVLFEDAGDPPDVPPLFAMSFIEGDSIEPNIDKGDELPPASDIEARARSSARMLAALHGVDADAGVLAGENPVQPSDEVARWTASFATVDERLRQGADELGAALAKAVPITVQPALGHGDFRLGNMLCRGPEVRGVIDWEIWYYGDPRIDLGWFLLAADADAHPSAIRQAPGMPRSPELLKEYVAAGGRTTDEFEFFRALTLFKLGAVVALITKNNLKAGADPAIVDERGASIARTIQRGRQVLDAR